MAQRYAEYFPSSSRRACRPSCWTRSCCSSTWPLGAALKAERDLQFDYLGLQTLYDRYFLHVDERASRCRRPSSCAWPWAWR
jgi:ribonucleoside-diphosphate reductase alpha chain